MRDWWREVSNREMWRSLFSDLWKIVKQHPILALYPVTLYLHFFERETLHRMFDEALESDA